MFCSALTKVNKSAPVSRWMLVRICPWTFIACSTPNSLLRFPCLHQIKAKNIPKILREIAALRNSSFRGPNLPPTAPHVTSVQNRLSFFAADMSHNTLSEEFTSVNVRNELQAVSSLCLNFASKQDYGYYQYMKQNGDIYSTKCFLQICMCILN